MQLIRRVNGVNNNDVRVLLGDIGTEFWMAIPLPKSGLKEWTYPDTVVVDKAYWEVVGELDPPSDPVPATS